VKTGRKPRKKNGRNSIKNSKKERMIALDIANATGHGLASSYRRLWHHPWQNVESIESSNTSFPLRGEHAS
jgi:hypothetical protein